MSYTWIKECMVCKGKELYMAMDFGEVPLPNTYSEKVTVLPRYHMELMQCKDCKHFQLGGSASPEEQFENYLYVSGTSKTLDDHFNALVEAFK